MVPIWPTVAAVRRPSHPWALSGWWAARFARKVKVSGTIVNKVCHMWLPRKDCPGPKHNEDRRHQEGIGQMLQHRHQAHAEDHGEQGGHRGPTPMYLSKGLIRERGDEQDDTAKDVEEMTCGGEGNEAARNQIITNQQRSMVDDYRSGSDTQDLEDVTRAKCFKLRIK